MKKLVYSVSQAGRWGQVVLKFLRKSIFSISEIVFFKCRTWFFFFFLSWPQWSLSNGSPFFYWYLTLFINFGQISYGEIWRSLTSCVNAHITEERVPLMSAAVSAHSLLMPRRVIEKWCSAGHVLQAEAGRECSCRHKSIWNSSPPCFFLYTLCFFFTHSACALLCGKASILLVISQLFCLQESAKLVTKITRWEDTMTGVASLQELF